MTFWWYILGSLLLSYLVVQVKYHDKKNLWRSRQQETVCRGLRWASNLVVAWGKCVKLAFPPASWRARWWGTYLSLKVGYPLRHMQLRFLKPHWVDASSIASRPRGWTTLHVHSFWHRPKLLQIFSFLPVCSHGQGKLVSWVFWVETSWAVYFL